VTTVETTTSSRSSTPKQISELSRRRSSTTFDGDREASPIPAAGSSGFSRIARGGSVRALSQKFQQAAGEGTGISFLMLTVVLTDPCNLLSFEILVEMIPYNIAVIITICPYTTTFILKYHTISSFMVLSGTVPSGLLYYSIL
jgi:hypothetical protein